MRRVFVDRDRRISSGGSFVDVGQINREGLVIGQPAAVRHPHRHAVAGGRFVVQQAPIGHCNHARAAVNRKPPTRIISKAIGLGVATIGIHPVHRADRCPVHGIFGHDVTGQSQIRRCVIDCGHRNREGVRIGCPCTISGCDGQHIEAREVEIPLVDQRSQRRVQISLSTTQSHHPRSIAAPADCYGTT